MIEIEARISELDNLGLLRKTRLVSGPQGPRVILDGKPALLLCSNNYLGLADHPRVREAAAEAAMRWGAGAGAPRLSSGTMTIHRRLEERLAAFLHRQSVLLFGSGYLAGLGAIAALARPGDVVFADEHNRDSIDNGCRLSGAEVFVYEHLDLEHLRWGIAKAEGRGALIVTDAVFALDGDVAPLADIVELAQRRRLRVAVDEGHGIGTLGPGGRGAVAELGLEDEVDVVVGTLGNSLGSYGGFVACHREMADYLLNAARTLSASSAPSPPAAAAAVAALTLLEHRPELVAKLQANVGLLIRELERYGFYFEPGRVPILSIATGDAGLTNRACELALQRGVLTDPIGPPVVPAAAARLRLAVMASHRPVELCHAAEVVAGAVRAVGLEPEAKPLEDPPPAPARVPARAPALQIFDVEAVEPLAA